MLGGWTFSASNSGGSDEVPLKLAVNNPAGSERNFQLLYIVMDGADEPWIVSLYEGASSLGSGNGDEGVEITPVPLSRSTMEVATVATAFGTNEDPTNPDVPEGVVIIQGFLNVPSVHRSGEDIVRFTDSALLTPGYGIVVEADVGTDETRYINLFWREV